MPALLVIADAPDEVILSAGKASSWIQVGKTGKFNDPRYGTFSIKEGDFDLWIKNFNTLNKGDGRLGLPIDVDHSPEKKGETEAAGWITSLQKRADGKELWALAEWNELGKTLVSERRYAYLSPSYTADYKDETGKSFGTALLGVALTNRPFLSMATVTLSKYGSQELTEEAEGAPPTKDTQEENMPELKNIALALGLGEDADEATILAKLTEQKPTQPGSINLDELAQAQGKVLLSADQVQALAADAASGREANKTLSTMKFSTAWNDAVGKGGMVPADEETYKALYDVKPDETLKLLAAAAERGGKLNVEPAGHGAPSDPTDPMFLAEDMKDPLGQYSVDKDALKVHNRALTLSSERKIDYAEAVALAESGV